MGLFSRKEVDPSIKILKLLRKKKRLEEFLKKSNEYEHELVTDIELTKQAIRHIDSVSEGRSRDQLESLKQKRAIKARQLESLTETLLKQARAEESVIAGIVGDDRTVEAIVTGDIKLSADRSAILQRAYERHYS